jgi:hypothetical protein
MLSVQQRLMFANNYRFGWIPSMARRWSLSLSTRLYFDRFFGRSPLPTVPMSLPTVRMPEDCS